MAHDLSPRLVSLFQKSFAAPPEWAWPIPPSVPLIGKQYKPGQGLQVYASAENLTFMHGNQLEPRYEKPLAWDRYRYRFDNVGQSGDALFPDVGIQPVSDGGLLTAAAYVSHRLNLPTAPSPRAFLENIAVANWSKFVVDSETNEDPTKPEQLAPSYPFIREELGLLRPRFVLLAKSDDGNNEITQEFPNTTFIPVYQCTGQVINSHTLTKYENDGNQLRESGVGKQLAGWVEGTAKVSKEKFWWYLAHVETRMRELGLAS